MPRTKRLNDTQLRLIQLFEYASTPTEERELMDMLSKFYLQKFNLQRDKLMKEGKLDQKKIDTYLATHHHGKPIKV